MKRLYELRRDGVLVEGPLLAENVCAFHLLLVQNHGYKRQQDLPEAQRSRATATYVTRTGELVSAKVSDDKKRAQYQDDLPWFDVEGRQVKSP